MMRTLMKLLGFTLVLSSATAMGAETVGEGASSSALAAVPTKNADNTEMNTRDKDGNTLTAQKQTNSESEIATLAAVRSAIVDDDNLSTSAHNVKIVLANGVVTLRGPVKSASEKARVEQIARTVAGVRSVDNQLDIDAN
jgi:osmotically-inducible protein OsmY